MRTSQTTSGFVLSLFAVAGLAFGGLGCAFGELRFDDPMGRLYALEEIQDQYTQLVRWNDYYTALRYVDPELHETFLKREELELRFTDHQSGTLALDDTYRKSTVNVNYLAYKPDELIEKTVKEKQEWYRDGEGNAWRVRPHFIEIEEEPPPRVEPTESEILEPPVSAGSGNFWW